ncbi:MAG: glycerophosphodiester phosphodiesterase, partial [Chloroflexi bacterium]|nr:glycerophosphodiester phosphodiesterase [Chloroflexota bacterium]
MTRRDPRPWRREAPLAVAHRGQRATFPEQTLEAYRAAIDLGADGIEVDVQMSSDGELVMVHDLTLDRTTDGHGPVAAADWRTLRRLDAGSWFDPRFAGCRIPSLDETIDLAIAADVVLCVEIKGDPRAAVRTATAVASQLRSRGLEDTVFVSSFDHAALAWVRHVSDRLLLAPERLPESGAADADAAVRQARALGATVLQHRWEDLTPAVVDALHAAGTGVW